MGVERVKFSAWGAVYAGCEAETSGPGSPRRSERGGRRSRLPPQPRASPLSAFRTRESATRPNRPVCPAARPASSSASRPSGVARSTRDTPADRAIQAPSMRGTVAASWSAETNVWRVFERFAPPGAASREGASPEMPTSSIRSSPSLSDVTVTSSRLASNRSRTWAPNLRRTVRLSPRRSGTRCAPGLSQTRPRSARRWPA